LIETVFKREPGDEQIEMADFEAEEEGVDEGAPASASAAAGNGSGPAGLKTVNPPDLNPSDLEHPDLDPPDPDAGEDSPLRRSLANGSSQRCLRDIIAQTTRGRYGSRTRLADDGHAGGSQAHAGGGSHLSQFLAEKQRISRQSCDHGDALDCAVDTGSLLARGNRLAQLLAVGKRRICRERNTQVARSVPTESQLIEKQRISLFREREERTVATGLLGERRLTLTGEKDMANDAPLAGGENQLKQLLAEKQRISLSRERRAARTMSVVMGAFVLCWLPFFLMYVVMSFCPACQRSTDPRVVNFVVWLGYVNSSLNPLIYTVFNVDFRRAFAALLQPPYTMCRRRTVAL